MPTLRAAGRRREKPTANNQATPSKRRHAEGAQMQRAPLSRGKKAAGCKAPLLSPTSAPRMECNRIGRARPQAAARRERKGERRGGRRGDGKGKGEGRDAGNNPHRADATPQASKATVKLCHLRRHKPKKAAGQWVWPVPQRNPRKERKGCRIGAPWSGNFPLFTLFLISNTISTRRSAPPISLPGLSGTYREPAGPTRLTAPTGPTQTNHPYFYTLSLPSSDTKYSY